MYVGLGWLVVVSLPALLRGLDTPETVLVVAGGLLYSFGALVLATTRPNPWPRTFGYHEVWHAATIAAAACRYASSCSSCWACAAGPSRAVAAASGWDGGR